MEKEYLSIREVAGRVGVTQQTIRRWWKAGLMPAPHRLGKRIIRWRKIAVDEWLVGQGTALTERNEFGGTDSHDQA